MINSISIHGFKILEKIENLPLKKVTLISGKNNIGKTTILEALFLYLDFNSPENFNRLFSWRKFSGTWEPKEIWSKFFYNSDLTKEITISVNFSNVEKVQVNIRFLEDYETSVQMPVTVNEITTFRKNFPALEIIRSFNNSIDYKAYILCYGSYFNYLKETDLLQGQPSIFFMGGAMMLYERNAEYLGILDKAEEQEKILPLLRIFEPNLIRFQLINERGINIIYADLGNKKKVPVNMFGEGFCRCLTMALILATKNADVFLIDEVGSGIHYSFQKNLWNFLIEASELYKCQIIATTHSYDTIKAFNNIIKNNGNVSDFSYIRLGKNKDGIKPNIFSADTLDYSLSSELEIR